MFISKKKLNELIEDNERSRRDIKLLDKQVFGDSILGSLTKGSNVYQACEKINEHTRKLQAIMRYFNLEFEKAPNLRVIKTSSTTPEKT